MQSQHLIKGGEPTGHVPFHHCLHFVPVAAVWTAPSAIFPHQSDHFLFQSIVHIMDLGFYLPIWDATDEPISKLGVSCGPSNGETPVFC